MEKFLCFTYRAKSMLQQIFFSRRFQITAFPVAHLQNIRKCDRRFDEQKNWPNGIQETGTEKLSSSKVYFQPKMGRK